MRKTTLDMLVHRMMSDPVFRQNLLANPEVAVSEAGWDLPADDMAALKEWHRQLQYTTKMEELKASLEAFIASRRPC